MNARETWRSKVYHEKNSKKNWEGIKWLRLRRKVLKRDRYQCQMCKKFFAEEGLILTAHH